MNPSHFLISKSLKDIPLGESDNFIWYITQIGIAALLKENCRDISKFDPISEASMIALDLSKEEKELITIDDKEILLFYS
tara:strand:+ start:9772 stop:10011 length:240 start_codon:yes stop_codon:yes gene_type:complete